MSASPAREVALRAVRRTFEEGAYTDRALAGEADRAHLGERARGQAMRLAFGVVQQRATLDALVERLAGRSPARLEAPVLGALRVGLFELLMGDGTPDRAAVYEAVELAKGGRGSGHRLVNAVLRRAAREGPGLLAELEDGTPAGAAVRHSHPEWLARLWFEVLGADEARALMAADNEPAESALRANRLRSDPVALARELGPFAHPVEGWPDAVVLEGPFDAHGSALWAEGRFMPQSRAAQLPARLLDPQPGERVLDLCAAPGGKTTHLAALMGNAGQVVAVERRARRADALRETCRRMGAENVEVVRADATDPPAGHHDRVLLDPPCSGLGTLQSRPDLRWRASPEQIVELADAQASMLEAAGAALGSGGSLVYSTCTVSPVENEGQIERFLAAHPDFRLDDLGAELPALAHPRAPGCLLTLPHRDGTAGFFIARLSRR